MSPFTVSVFTLLLGFGFYLLKTVFCFLYHEKLLITDLRTFRVYSIPIKHNAVQATEFRKISPLGITASYWEHAAKGLVILDPGFKNTAVKESHITYIDGNRGILQYRQHPIGHLFAHHDYEDVVHLLVWGHLPTIEVKMKFRSQVAKFMVPDHSVLSVVQSFNPDTPAYLVIAAGLSAWVASHPNTIPVYRGDSIYQKDANAVNDGVGRAIAAFTTVVALTYCHQQGRPFDFKVDPALSSIENLLVMIGRVDHCGLPEKQTALVLNKIWILFADHEMTNSTAAFLNATSCLSDPMSALVAAVASANGPLHAGAIDLAYKGFEKMGNVSGVGRHMDDVRAKKCRLMGVGHRVYRTADPRISYLRSIMGDLEATTSQNRLLEVALEIDRIVATDSYFTSRALSINADLYSSFVYAALGFDQNIFTAFSMTARCAGLLAHWREGIGGQPCLWRPRQIFTGEVTS
ncbi:citrate synthase [Truncatella angustata]|uniref:Citrate synthase n=1 Tax=Truncatella angustata TaxID=152316 RepID=A0A9P9A248_9PEZI|nr:citrate synthase [Truncatella angustata]KAH6658759.1 citrate synthase [Truncatella angustata]